MADRTFARKVLETEVAAILALIDRLDARFDAAVQLMATHKHPVRRSACAQLGL